MHVLHAYSPERSCISFSTTVASFSITAPITSILLASTLTIPSCTFTMTLPSSILLASASNVPPIMLLPTISSKPMASISTPPLFSLSQTMWVSDAALVSKLLLPECSPIAPPILTAGSKSSLSILPLRNISTNSFMNFVSSGTASPSSCMVSIVPCFFFNSCMVMPCLSALSIPTAHCWYLSYTLLFPLIPTLR